MYTWNLRDVVLGPRLCHPNTAGDGHASDQPEPGAPAHYEVARAERWRSSLMRVPVLIDEWLSDRRLHTPERRGVRDGMPYREPASTVRLVLDASGLGLGVWDRLREAQRQEHLLRGVQSFGVIFTVGAGGQPPHYDAARQLWPAAKVDLVTNLVSIVEHQHLHIPSRLTHAQLLQQEIANFLARVNSATGRLSFEAGNATGMPLLGGGPHGDLVAATMLACWGMTVRLPQPNIRAL